MNLPSVKNADIKAKRVILRVDFNVLAKNGKVEEIYRIKKTLPTLRFLKNGGAKVIIISHLSFNKGNSLLAVAEYFNKNIKDLNVDFIRGNDWGVIKDKIGEMDNGDIVMLENLRMNDGEEANSDCFAKKLSGLGDIYVNEAFSVSHRPHASIVGIVKFLPSFVGPLFEEEVDTLQTIFKPTHPFLLILGGVKSGSKLGVLDRFLSIADKIFIGGALANCFLAAKGVDIGESFCDKKTQVGRYINSGKIFLPVDVKKKDNIIYDIGDETVKKLTEMARESKFIVWNGPMGNIEEAGFDEGTKVIARVISGLDAKTIVGGGDTVAIIDELGLINKFSFVSTGGGAMLEFLASGTLQGIEALKNKQ